MRGALVLKRTKGGDTITLVCNLEQCIAIKLFENKTAIRIWGTSPATESLYEAREGWTWKFTDPETGKLFGGN